MKKLIFGLAMLVSACGAPSPEEDRTSMQDYKEYQVRYLTNEGMYIKDKRTNLCFLTTGLRTDYAVLANVPCTPEVEKEINK